jgi:hypothetical protein
MTKKLKNVIYCADRLLGLSRNVRSDEEIGKEYRMKKALQIVITVFCASGALAAWDWFSALDENQDGKVTQAEWLKWNQAENKRKNAAFDAEKQKSYFSARDLNKDGVLTRDEFEASKVNKDKKILG